MTSRTCPDPSEFLLREYSALRDEVLKRTETQHQLVSLTLVAFGTLLTIGFKEDQTSPTVVLSYPILAGFLSLAWSQNNLRIREIGQYVRDEIEVRLAGDDLGWEHRHPSSDTGKKVGRRAQFAAVGVFLLTQVVAVGLAVLRADVPVTSYPFEDKVLLITDVLAMLLTAAVFVNLDVRRRDIEQVPKA